jgi:hypothetical protein
MTNRRNLRPIPALIALLAFPLAARGLIDVDFTPVQLVDQSGTILVARLRNKDVAGKVELEVSAALKGKAPAALGVDLGQAPAEHADAARKQLSRSAGRPVLLFAGKGKGAGAGFLHVNGMWLRLSGTGGDWRLDAVDQKMPSTWAGGTDMLTRCVQYVLADPATACVPVTAGTSWRATRKIGSVGGKACDICAADLAGDGRCCLFVAGERGDRLLRPSEGGTFEDVTQKVKLASRSCLAAWGDFDGDGRMDLASYDGKALTIWAQGGDGTFSATRPGGTLAIPEGCVGLAVLPVGTDRTPGLLLSPVSGQPTVLKPAGRNAFEAAALRAPLGAPQDRGKGQACLVADFNGDSFVDVIQPFEKGGMIYLGGKDCSLDAPRPCAVCSTVGGGRAALGDLDGDGLPDVVVAGAEGVRVFQNLGNGAFEESLDTSGEVAYKSQPLASWCGVCDFNNDSRHDLFITYGAQPMLLYFNRGFRSFGQAPKLETALEEIPDFGKGQQMALFADLGGSGAQDLFLVTGNGDIWCASNDLGGDNAGLCVKAKLPAGSPTPGPANACLWSKQRCLGTVVVQAGAAPGFFGIGAPGKYTLKWRFPGGKEASRDVVVKDKPVTVVLDGG